MNRIRKGDTVIVTTGKSKKHVGKVIAVNVAKNLVCVEGANLVTEFRKPNPNTNEKGGIYKKEGAIHASNVAIYNDATQKADKVGFKVIEKNGVPHKVRYFKSSGELIETVV